MRSQRDINSLKLFELYVLFFDLKLIIGPSEVWTRESCLSSASSNYGLLFADL
jgi:hypothetical protein